MNKACILVANFSASVLNFKIVLILLSILYSFYYQ